MEKELNLVEILKDCPNGTKLYSPIFGDVLFMQINDHDEINVSIIKHECSVVFLKNGAWNYSHTGECLLFPSKENRDWSTFKVEEPKFDINTLQSFDKVLVRGSNDETWKCGYFSSMNNFYPKFSCVGNCYSQCIPYNKETKHLVGTTETPPTKYITWEE